MSKFKPFPELTVAPGMVEDLHSIQTVSGRVLIAGRFANADEAQRFVDCWNGCRKITFPGAHIEASAEYATRTEQLRKDAWARAEVLQAEVDHLRSLAKETADWIAA